jgi:hypothetical protein
MCWCQTMGRKDADRQSWGVGNRIRLTPLAHLAPINYTANPARTRRSSLIFCRRASFYSLFWSRFSQSVNQSTQGSRSNMQVTGLQHQRVTGEGWTSDLTSRESIRHHEGCNLSNLGRMRRHASYLCRQTHFSAPDLDFFALWIGFRRPLSL